MKIYNIVIRKKLYDISGGFNDEDFTEVFSYKELSDAQDRLSELYNDSYNLVIKRNHERGDRIGLLHELRNRLLSHNGNDSSFDIRDDFSKSYITGILIESELK